MKIKILILTLLIPAFSINLKAQNTMDNNPQLDNKQQSMVSISALTATGDMEQLKRELTDGLKAGLTVNQIKEIMVQLYAYCGFPRSLNAINAFMAVLQERKAKGIYDTEGKNSSQTVDADRYQTGKKNLQKLTGKEEKTLSGANAFAPAIDQFLKEHLFADIFSRDVLNFQQRELVTVSALAAMSGVSAQLEAHITMAMNTGLTEGQLLNAFSIIDKTGDNSQGNSARSSLKKVLATNK